MENNQPNPQPTGINPEILQARVEAEAKRRMMELEKPKENEKRKFLYSFS